jgi:hypothetical protein
LPSWAAVWPRIFSSGQSRPVFRRTRFQKQDRSTFRQIYPPDGVCAHRVNTREIELSARVSLRHFFEAFGDELIDAFSRLRGLFGDAAMKLRGDAQ